MTIYAGHQTSIAISEVLESPSFATLKGVRSSRWRIEHEMDEAFPVSDDNWARHTTTTKRRLSMVCELYGASHTAQARIKTAALSGTHIRAKLTLANGTILEGNVQIAHYEEFASDDEMLEVEVRLVSVAAVTITA